MGSPIDMCCYPNHEMAYHLMTDSAVMSIGRNSGGAAEEQRKAYKDSESMIADELSVHTPTSSSHGWNLGRINWTSEEDTEDQRRRQSLRDHHCDCSSSNPCIN
ncbi:hypothetical protein JTB14_024249 [Gonioctena quinquepunctata]|nr:hypothetical protein JTB14_024249 [Gonioctena quinquepunctata]